MAVDMRFTNGTDTISLTSDGIGVLDYRPVMAAPKAMSVTEPLALLFTGGADVALDSIQTLNRLLGLAEDAQAFRRTVPTVYLEVKRDTDTDWWRSEVLSVSGELTENVLDTEYAAGMFTVQLSITREPFFEGPLTTIGLRNNNTFGVYETDPVQIWNANDSGKDNFVAYAADSIAGDLPAPVKLTLANTYNDTRRMADVYIGLNLFSDPESFNPILEAESADVKYGGATPTLNVSYSGGYFVTLSWNVQTVIDLLTWDLDADFLASCNGGRFKVIARRDGLTGAQLRVKVTNGVTDYFVGDWVSPTAAQKQVELNAVVLPPYSVGLANVFGLSLVLQARRQQSGTHTETIDFVQLTPTDGYRRLLSQGNYVSYTVTLVDDAIEGDIYTDGWASAGKLRNYRAEGQLLVLPNRLGRIFFLWTGSTGDADYLRTATVQMHYRPRRRAL